MKFFQYFNIDRSTVLKYLLAAFFLLAVHLIFDMGNLAFPDESAFYSIHLLSFKEVKEARAKVKEFNDLGYNAFYRQETADGKANIYNVYIERFKSRTEAEKEANILKGLDLISDYDIRELVEKTQTNFKNDRQEVKNNKQDEKGYYLKVSSLKEKANAEEVVKTLQDAGYNAFYSYENVKGKGDWYRVYIDGYQSREDAERDAKKLMGSAIISGYEIQRATGKVQPAETIKK